MRLPRRTFLRSASCLTIGFCLAESFIAKAMAPASIGNPNQPGSLPGDLRDDPRIDSWLQVLEDGRIRVLTGKIELGQGIRTAVAQMAAEELDLDMDQVEVRMAETGVTPNEGYTAGSNSIEASAIAVRYAAAAARQKLLDLAAQKLGTPVADLTFSKATITAKNGRSISLAALLEGKQISDEVHMPATIKPKDQHRLVGKPIPRPDNEPIVYGRPYYVHDLQLPGMVYGRIVRPPVYGAHLEQIDEDTVRQQSPGLLKIVVNGSFLGVIATTEYAAIKAQNLVRKHSKWTDGPLLPRLTPGQLPDYLRSLPVRSENVRRQGDLSASTTIKASYFKPYIMHGSIGPSCAVAHFENNHLDVWSHSQGAYPLRESLAALVNLPAADIHVKGVPGSGCYGHNGADDVAADAVLLAMAYPGKPVHLQWAREDEHAWEPYGSAMLLDLEARLDTEGRITHWKYALYSDTHGARPSGHAGNLLAARYLERPFTARPSGFSGGANRNAEPYYDIPNQQIQANFFDGPLRTSSLRSLGAYANIFAIESFMDELAAKAGKDPYEFRLLHLHDPRAIDVLKKLRERVPRSNVGIAFSRYKNSGTYCAVAAHVSVRGKAVTVHKLWAVVDAGEVINLDGIRNQIEGGLVQSASWTLFEQVKFDPEHISSTTWATYPILHFDQAPEVEVIVLDRPAEQPMGAGEAAQGPAAAAILNAIHKACGKRIRRLPVSSAILV